MKYAAIFPGQGSQHVGMCESLIKERPIAKQTFEEASDTLGFDTMEMALKGPEENLQLTENTQPMLLTASVATYRSLMDMGVDSPQAMAGHSVGEYPALVCANVLSFAKAVELTRLRGQLMQKSVPIGEGGMLAVLGLEPSEVKQLCQWAEKESGLSPVEPANFNAPGQIVISGRADLLRWISQNFTPEKIASDKKRVKLIPLKVSAPFHCSMMTTAQKEMAAALNETEFSKAQIPVVQNVSGQPNVDPNNLREQLIKQISSPVQWVQCMETLKSMELTEIAELGPGQVLSGLAKKIDKQFFQCTALNDLDTLQNFVDRMTETSSANPQG